MDSRALHVYMAMKRIADVIEADPYLKARAAESRACERFVQEIAALEELAAREKQAKINRPLLRMQLEQLVTLIMVELKCIDGAHQLSGRYWDVFSSVKKPSKETHVCHFINGVQGYLVSMEAHRERLIDAGLHPSKFDDARKLLAHFAETHHSWSLADAAIREVPNLLKIWVERAQGRGELLHNELYSAMSKEAHAKWNTAAALGRAHRPHALGPSIQRALPAPQKSEIAHKGESVAQGTLEPAPSNSVVSGVSKPSLSKRTVRAVLRVFGDTDGDAAA